MTIKLPINIELNVPKIGLVASENLGLTQGKWKIETFLKSVRDPNGTVRQRASEHSERCELIRGLVKNLSMGDPAQTSPALWCRFVEAYIS